MLSKANSIYVKFAKDLSIFVQRIYRNLEPSHFQGKLIVFFKENDVEDFQTNASEKFYDNGMLNEGYESIVFQLFQNGRIPHIWTNVNQISIDTLLLLWFSLTGSKKG